MKIKKVNLVTNEDLQGLLRNLNFCITSITEGRERDAIWTLKRLVNNIENNLKDDGNDLS